MIPVDAETRSFESASAFSRWLAANHSRVPCLWLKFGKRASGRASITYPEAVEVALAWGWIDGQKARIDACWWAQRFTPRGPRSIWSKINCQKAEALIASGKMMKSGMAEVERAKADGRWDAAYESPKSSTVPPDLARALAAKPRARRFFETLDAANRYAVLWRIHTAKKPETRAARIEKFVAMLERGERLHP